MWQRLIELPCPLLLMFGKNDRVTRTSAPPCSKKNTPNSICISSTIANTSCNGMRRRSFTNELHNFFRIRPCLIALEEWRKQLSWVSHRPPGQRLAAYFLPLVPVT